jgi:hypothetical protein
MDMLNFMTSVYNTRQMSKGKEVGFAVDSDLTQESGKAELNALKPRAEFCGEAQEYEKRVWEGDTGDVRL